MLHAWKTDFVHLKVGKTLVVNEIAMVFVNSDGEPPFDRDIKIYPKNHLKR